MRIHLAAWEKRQHEIIGEPGQVGSLEYWKHQLQALRELPEKISSAAEVCLNLSAQIYDLKLKLASVHRDHYRPVQDFIEHHELAANHLRMSFQAEISESGFVDAFLDFINQGKRGSFSGVSEGRERISLLCNQADFNSKQGVRDFLVQLLKMLHLDARSTDQEEVQVKDQLAKGTSVALFYQFVFSLGYLKTTYTLTWGGKDIAQLSPGERGTLLLVFYLLIDRSDIPLVIDQPEENLDNQTVYEVLVPCIKEAKCTRQIFIVTHNPNLAVVCDADQIIYAEFDKPNNHLVKYIFGAIENPSINKRILDVLEGTRPAFDNRREKYFPTTQI